MLISPYQLFQKKFQNLTKYQLSIIKLASCHLLALVSKLNSSGGRSRGSELVSPLCNQADPSRPNEYEYGWIRYECGTLTQLITLGVFYTDPYISVIMKGRTN